jgi:hypothetical protein
LEKQHVVDLIIADYPNGLRVLDVWDPPSQIPYWNANILSFLNILMAFALTYLHDNGEIILFYLNNSMMKREVVEFFETTSLRSRMSGLSLIAYT